MKKALTMAKRLNLQDVILHLCENPNPELYSLCNISLFKTCAEEHLLDETKIHTVIPIKQQRSISLSYMSKHSTNVCELHCQKCNVSICTRLFLQKNIHSEHNAEDLMTTFEIKKETLKGIVEILFR